MSVPNDGKCCFCGAPYGKPGWDGGNNPEPLQPYDSARACDNCNASLVIPARLGFTIVFQDGVWAPKSLPPMPESGK